MKRKELLQEVKQTVLELEPDAKIVLYGSRSRNEAGPESDWDFLVLVDGVVDDARVDAIRHRLYEIEWASGEVICTIVRSRRDWSSPPYGAMPFHEHVEREGIPI
ncbi:nucleotidyltransferase domain-containing protein [Candidatus Sumerlaeota bacterium]|nr:nucleotidyltransferase domain-containing protein [Candidatus Sumerlaeota bacterium]